MYRRHVRTAQRPRDLGKKLESEGMKVDFFDIKTPDGLTEAVMFDVMTTPSIVIVDDENNEVHAWRRECS